MEIRLDTGWLVRQEEMECGPGSAAVVARRQDKWMSVNLPCDVRMPLIENGIIRDPVLSDYCFESEWVERKSWWFKKTFHIDQETLQSDEVELVLESLDASADIFLNGVPLGHHASAHYAFSKDVKPWLLAGDNELLVRMTAGLETVSENDYARMRYNISLESDQGRGPRGDLRRALLRKPQYAMGWDWGPRVTSCGIMKGTYLLTKKGTAIEEIHAVTTSIVEGQAEVRFETVINSLKELSTQDATLSIELKYNGISVAQAERELYLQSGLNFADAYLAVEQPKLWWPNGTGAPALYTATVTVRTAEVTVSKEIRFGIRTVKLFTDKLDGRRLFGIEVNGLRIFAKGGNWVPADSIYARVTAEKYRTLVDEAANANFNLLRVWGGGLYERDVFYEACDEKGILIWQDFMFACALYPDDEPWFREEVAREMDYQTKRLRNHPCIALFCGNNENHTAYASWWKGEATPKFFGGAKCYHYLAPQAVRRNCPEISYWPGSPYGGEDPAEALQGDIHPWGHFFMNADMERRITPQMYDELDASYVSEYGYVGPCGKKTTLQYLDGAPAERGSAVWNHHNNTFEKDTVMAGIAKHFSTRTDLSLDEYLTYAGVCQGMMLGSSLEAFRAKPLCHGSTFWMYNDTWGEVGWTIIDYYLRRKISYYYVKRALAPIKLIVRRQGEDMVVTGVNETAEDLSVTVSCGFMRYDGTALKEETLPLTLPARFRGECARLAFPPRTELGIHYVHPLNCSLPPVVLAERPARDMQLPQPTFTVSDVTLKDGALSFTVQSDVYTYGVHFNLGDDVHLSDEYFELLPGQAARVTAYGAKELQQIKPCAVLGS